MFNTLIESQGNAQLTRNAASFFSSLVLHATIFVGLLAAPLFFLEPKAEFFSAAPPPPPPLKLGSRSGAVKVLATGHQSRSQRPSSPLAILRKVSLPPILDEPPTPPIGVGAKSFGPFFPGSGGGFANIGVPGGVSEPGSQSFVPAQTAVEAPAAEPQRIRIRQGGEIQRANLIRLVKPDYPPQAKMVRAQGAVVLDAIISVDGNVERLSIVSGHPLLIDAAIRAVQQWKYRPTLLNGVPVEVLTQITINFALGQ